MVESLKNTIGVQNLRESKKATLSQTPNKSRVEKSDSKPVDKLKRSEKDTLERIHKS